MLVRIWNPCFTWKRLTVWKVAAHLCLTLSVKELKNSVEQGRLVTTKYNQTLRILFGVGSMHTEESGYCDISWLVINDDVGRKWLQHRMVTHVKTQNLVFNISSFIQFPADRVASSCLLESLLPSRLATWCSENTRNLLTHQQQQSNSHVHLQAPVGWITSFGNLDQSNNDPAFLQQNCRMQITFKRPPPPPPSMQAGSSALLQNFCWSELASCNEIWGVGVGSNADPIFVAECITNCERGRWKPVSWRERTWSVVDCRQCEPGQWELRYHFFLI